MHCFYANTSTSYDCSIQLFTPFKGKSAQVLRNLHWKFMIRCVDLDAQSTTVSHMYICLPIQKRVSYSNYPSQTHVKQKLPVPKNQPYSNACITNTTQSPNALLT